MRHELPGVNEQVLKTIMAEPSLDMIRLCRESPEIFAATEFGRAALALPNGYAQAMKRVTFEVMRMIATGWFDADRIREASRFLSAA
ncbi:MAG TPA: hypothetical protein PK765_00305 [bacterium]|nr:hypothetical protein [bacterium]